MEEKLEKTEEITLCERCNHIYTKKEEDRDDCSECGEWGKKYATKLTITKIYYK